MSEHNKSLNNTTENYIHNRRKLRGFLFERALPNEYIVQIGKKNVKPILGGKKIRLFKRFLRIPAFVQTLYFKTDNANIDYQGIGLEGYATWRIDPKRPEVAIRVLNFYDEFDPMANTNNQLRTICIEAVRHVIANMNINDALKKKDDIAENLKTQLKPIEEKWGIIFDEIGIEKVVIMSNKLFEELQSQYRDKLRLETSKTKIETDRLIATEQNSTREKTELERILTDQKIQTANLENESLIKDKKLVEEQKYIQKQLQYKEQEYLEEVKFREQKENKEHELSLLNNKLQTQLETDKALLLKAISLVEKIKNEISLEELNVRRQSIEIDQSYTDQYIINNFISKLPELFKNINIDNYSVMDYNGNGNISPVTKVFNDIIQILKNSDFKWLLNKKENTDIEE